MKDILKKVWAAMKRGRTMDNTAIGIYSLLVFWIARKIGTLILFYLALLLALWIIKGIKAKTAV